MQLAPTAPSIRTVDTTASLQGHQVVARGTFAPGHSSDRPLHASFWTVGEDLAPLGGWDSKEQAISAAKLLSTEHAAPIALTWAPHSGGGWPGLPAVVTRYHLHRIARSTLADSEPSPRQPEPEPGELITDVTLARDGFRSFRGHSFQLVDLFAKGASLTT